LWQSEKAKERLLLIKFIEGEGVGFIIGFNAFYIQQKRLTLTVSIYSIKTGQVNRVTARLKTGGKSELHRAGCWVMPRRGDPTESATETYRPASSGVRVKW